MSDGVSPATNTTPRRHKRRRGDPVHHGVHDQIRTALLPLLLVDGALLGSAALAWWTLPLPPGSILGALACGLGVSGLISWGRTRAAVRAVRRDFDDQLAGVQGVIAEVEKAAQAAVDALLRGEGVPAPFVFVPAAGDDPSTTETKRLLGELQERVVCSLAEVHASRQSAVLLEVLRRLAQREHALVERALAALSDLEGATDDAELLHRIYQLDHLVTRIRRQVESTGVLGGQSLRATRRPASVSVVLRGAVSEVVAYPRVDVVAGTARPSLRPPSRQRATRGSARSSTRAAGPTPPRRPGQPSPTALSTTGGGMSPIHRPSR